MSPYTTNPISSISKLNSNFLHTYENDTFSQSSSIAFVTIQILLLIIVIETQQKNRIDSTKLCRNVPADEVAFASPNSSATYFRFFFSMLRFCHNNISTVFFKKNKNIFVCFTNLACIRCANPASAIFFYYYYLFNKAN